jgi:WD40 repeat protein
MELVRGTPLDRVLEAGPMPVERAVPFLRRLCEVVHTAHEQGIVHRDLKPSNVMVISRAGSVFPKLIDLGIARDEGTRDPGGDAERAGPLGTPFYMAPEQWVAPEKAGPPADIYALGAITYEVLVGKPPFDGDSVLAVAVQHAKKPPPRLPDGFANGLSDAIARAMAKRAAQRFGAAIELGAALADAAGVGADTVPLPRLEDRLRTEVMLSAPQPIAEAVAVVDSASNPHQAQLALRQAARVIAQYVALVALACRTRAGPGRRSDGDGVLEPLRALRRSGLETDAWWLLARELARPFAAIPDAHPIPELVALFFAGGTARPTAMDELAPALADASTSAADHVRRTLADAVPRLGALLESVGFLAEYRIVVPGPRAPGTPKAEPPYDGSARATSVVRADAWMGVRRPQRAAVELDGALPAGRPLLVGRDGRAAVTLWPLVQAAAPSPNAPLELFLLDGARRGAACLVAPPHGFEHQDDQVWDWLGRQLGAPDAADGALASEASPYRGLSTFQESDAGSFLGREREVDALVNRLRTTPLLAVVGPSGVGKSSFVRAGVLPALRRTESIVTATLRPGHAPIAGLAVQLAALGIDIDAASIARAPDALGDRVRAFAAGGTGVVVIVDQLEELFTLCRDAAERTAYVAALAGMARAAEDPVRVIATVRDDFLVRMSMLEPLRERLTASLHILTTPAPDELRRILVEPARRAGYEFEDAALLDEMIADVLDRPGALALLSFTAFQLWELRDRHFHRLPRKAYLALGGVGGALGRHAEDTLDAMSAEQQRLVRVAFRHLITAEGTRAVVREDDLVAALAGAASDPRVAAWVLERLIEARLVVVSEGDRGEHRVEITHEALLSAWPRLVTWRREDADGVRFRDHLRAAAKQWEERGRPAGLLWRGDALVEYQLWRPRFPDALAAVEDEFARASEAAAARSRRVRRAIVGGLLVTMAVVSLVLWRLNARAVAAADDAHERMLASLIEQGRQAALRGENDEALVYLAEAYQRGADTVALRFLLGRAARATGAYEVAIPIDRPLIATKTSGLSPDGTRLVGATADELRVWDLSTGRIVARRATPVPIRELAVDPGAARVLAWPAVAGGSGAALWSPADDTLRVVGAELAGPFGGFTPDGAEVWLASASGAVGAWDAATGGDRAALHVPAKPIQVAFAPGGRRIASVSIDRVLRVWDAARPDPPLSATSLAEVTGGLAFTPSGDRLLSWAMTGDCAATLWDPVAGAPAVVMTGHRQAITATAISTDGTRIATGSRDRTVKIWDAASGRLIVDLEGHRAVVSAIAFSRDGARVLTVSTDRTARVWDATTGAEIAVISQPDLRQAAIAADGARVVTTSPTAVKVWRAADPELVVALPGHSTIAIGAAFSTDGKWIATEDRRQVVRLWDRRTGTVVRAHAEHDLGPDETEAVFGLLLHHQRKLPAIDPGGTQIVAPVGKDVAVWSIDGGARVATLTGHTALVSSARFSRDGEFLVTAAQDGTAIVWDARTRRPLQTLAAGGTLWYAEASPDGTRVITVGSAGLVLWDWRSASRVREHGAGDDLQSGAFSADGRRIAAAGGGGRVGVWSVADGGQVATIDTGSRNVRAVRFVGNELVATTAGDGLTRVWDVARQVELARFATGGLGSEGGGIERWAEVDPDGRALAVTGTDRTARVWSLELERRSPAEVAAWVRCQVPLALDDQRIVPRPLAAEGCR